MKKFSTLALMAFFCCLSAMAQIQLGDISFSLGEGKKISPTTGKITVTFPNVTGVADPTTTSFVLAGAFNDNEFDGVEGTFAAGVIFDLFEFELQPATDYTLKITSVKVDGTELAAEGGYALNFKTRSAERKMSWSFAIADETLEVIAADATANAEAQDVTHFIDITKSGNPRYYVPARNYEEIQLPDGTALAETEDLLFKFGSKSFYVSGHTGGWGDAICFNNQNQFLVIPDCQEGDVIIFNANRATSGSASKQTCIQAMNGAAIAPDGLVSSTELQDSVWLGSSFMNFKFEVQTAGDITFRFSNCILKSINITEAQPKVPCKYRIVAAYVDAENDTKVELKELVGETEGISGTTVKAQFPYWVADGEGNVYTHAAISKEFNVSFELNSDTTFVMEYNKTDFSGVVFLSEGEDLTGAVEVTSGNAAVRSSMGKAGYVTEDLKLVTLQPGTYKIRAILFDAEKSPSYVCTLTKGEGEENEIYLSATATNWTDAESDLLTIETATDITLKAGGNGNQGIDVIMIYASTDAPEDPDGITEVNAAAQKAIRKVVKNGRLVIETAAGTFNAIGVEVK
jgi:hypothetical protein